MENVSVYIEKNKERFLNELFSLLKIPSISAKPEHKDDMFKACGYIKSQLLDAGADTIEVIATKGHQ